MPIFRNAGGKLSKLGAIPLSKEKELQALIETNLKEVLDLQFLHTDLHTRTSFGVAYNKAEFEHIVRTGLDASPTTEVLIEESVLGWKEFELEVMRDKNDNVINQALSYLKWLKSQKPGFFEKLMIDKLGDTVAKSIGLDWDNPRVICIAEAYSKFDIDTVEVVPLRIELFRYRYYEDNVFALEPVNVTEAPNYVTQANPAKSTSSPTSSTGVEGLLAKADDNTAELFKELRERILELDDTVEEKATTLYVAYKRSNNFAAAPSSGPNNDRSRYRYRFRLAATALLATIAPAEMARIPTWTSETPG